MQTFLPYSDYETVAKTLDYRRLGKQRVECWQMLEALTGRTNAWCNHPATKMWAGYEYQLALYGYHMSREWRRRGYVDNMAQRFCGALLDLPLCSRPSWLTDERLNSSHRAALLAKAPNWYNQWGWTEEPKVKYWWPTEERKEN